MPMSGLVVRGHITNSVVTKGHLTGLTKFLRLHVPQIFIRVFARFTPTIDVRGRF